MAASQIPLLLLALLILTASATAQELTIHQILQGYGFPAGLLPNTVESYTPIFYPRIGVAYAVNLTGPCHVNYGSIEVNFDSEITIAFIFSGGRIRDLTGFKLFGQNITDIQAGGNLLYLSSPSGFKIFLDAKLFESIPICDVTAGKPSSKLISQVTEA